MYWLLAIPLCLMEACALEKIEPSGPSAPLRTFEAHFTALGGNTVQVESVVPIVSAQDSGYLVSGYLTNNFNFTQLFVTRLSPSGAKQGTVTNFGLNGASSGGRMIRTSDGKYALVGTDFDSGDTSLVVIKLNTDLTVAWKRVYGKPGKIEYGTDIVETADGNLVAAGSANSEFREDPFFVKLRLSDGQQLDSNTVVFSGFGRYRPTALARNGNTFAVTGYNAGLSVPLPFFLKIDANLNDLVNVSLSTTGGRNGGLEANGTDGFLMADGTETQTASKAYLLKLSGNGDEAGTFNEFEDAQYSGLSTIVRTTNGSYLIGGWQGPLGSADGVASAALVSPTFVTQHSYTFPNTSTNTYFRAGATTADGGFVLAGIYGTNEVLVVKLDAELMLN